MTVILLFALAHAPRGRFSAGASKPGAPTAVTRSPDRISEEADRIGARFGVTVLTGNSAAISLPPYKAEPCRDSERMTEALREAEETLELYPEGFFCAVAGEGELVLALCGRISANGRGALGSVSALTGRSGGAVVILIDANGSEISRSLMHEIVHAADMRLDEAAGEDSPYWGDAAWSRLDPPGFSSFGAYTLPDGSPYADTAPSDYIAEPGRPPEEVWFADRYSTTFPTEDRAVLFETLMRCPPGSELFESPHIIAKLRFMFAAARRYLDPGGNWTEPTFWEKKLEEVSGMDTKGAVRGPLLF